MENGKLRTVAHPAGVDMFDTRAMNARAQLDAPAARPPHEA